MADYLEQTFTKDEMMELYLNIIEFGPDLYGVTVAAQHYFGRRPNELNLAESLFLSSILPNPVAFHHVYEKGTSLNDVWMRTIRARMETARAQRLDIPSRSLQRGSPRRSRFIVRGDPPLTPRPAVSTASHRASAADWQELN